jgi:hypothetical protein
MPGYQVRLGWRAKVGMTNPDVGLVWPLWAEAWNPRPGGRDVGTKAPRTS